VSLSLFPLLALPIAEDVFGMKQDAYLERLVDHTERMFRRGARA
jgi:hypothetical protein